MLAQATTTVPVIEVLVDQGDDWFAIVVALIAVIVAATVGGLTVKQGRVINSIETREHDWEHRDRNSAYVQVTRDSFRRPISMPILGSTERAASFRNEWAIRLTNTGRVDAVDLKWKVEYDGGGDRDTLDGKDVLAVPTRELAILHPGEHFDLPMEFGTHNAGATVAFTIGWNDPQGSHTTYRLINW